MPKKSEKQDHYFTVHPKSEIKHGLICTNLRGKRFEFLTASGVFSKTHIDMGTRLLVESMVLPDEGCVLDIGCGYGAVGVAAAVFSPSLHVIMTDVNERAVWLAKQNVKRNFVGNADVRLGFLYEPVEGVVFNCILSNPPVSAGMETVRKIIVDAPVHMVKGANFHMVLRSKVAGKRLLLFFEEAFGNVAVLARKSGYRVLIAEKQ